MADVSDVIAALECFETKHKPCARCPFNPAPGMQWAYGCQRGERDIAEAARELLRDYERRVADGDDHDQASG